MIRFFLFIGCIGFASLVSAQTLAELREEAEDYWDRGKYKRAIKVYDELIELAPDSIEFYILRARMHFYKGDVEGCMAGFASTMKTFPNHWYPYYYRSTFYEKMHHWDKGILDAKDAVKYAPNDSIRGICQATLGSIYWKIQEFEKAREACLAALQIDSNNEVALNSYAMVLSELDEQEEALEVLYRLYDLDSVSNQFAFQNIAFIYMELERYEESLEMFNEVIERSHQDAYGHNNRGYVKLQLGQVEEALKDINRSIDLDPNNAYAYRNKALVLLELGETDKACEEMENALRYNFTRQYGNEVNELRNAHCFK